MTLRDLDPADLFDAIHVLYEEDVTPMWEQHMDVKDRVREALYPMLYGKPYKYSVTKPSMDGAEQDWDNGIPASGSSSKAVKPYIPPSTEADLMRVLGPPVN